MLKVFLIVYGTSGTMIDRLPTPSMSKCLELSARMTMLDFSVPASERLSYNCKYDFLKPRDIAGAF